MPYNATAVREWHSAHHAAHDKNKNAWSASEYENTI